MRTEKLNNAVGQRVRIYDVLYECDHKSKDGHKLYHVKCRECGWETDMEFRFISIAKGCKHILLGGHYIQTNFKWENHRLQIIFRNIKRRCYDADEKSFRWYGAKGIKVCDEWLENPKAFEDWAFKNGYADTLTINRIDEEKDYCPENCEWISSKENSRYKSTTNSITVGGVTHSGREWADILNIGTNTINTYIRDYGEEKTKQLIDNMLNFEPRDRKHGETWFETYGVS